MSVLPIAISEDDPLVWYPAEGVSRRAAKRAAAAEMDCGPARRYRACRRYMRPLDQQDCPAWPHGEDEDGELPVDCRCYWIEEGWHEECERAHPDAIAVWRIELRGQLRYWFWHQMRKWVYRTRAFDGRPVLWGGRVDRNATWIDYLLTGRARGFKVYCGDRWFKPGETELLWCPSCKATTPHDPGFRGEGWCLASGHGEKKAAPFATDVKFSDGREAL